MQRNNIYQQLLLNLVPVIGYWFLDWSMFAIVYIYWVEALLVGFFLALRVLLSKGADPVTGRLMPLSRRIGKALKTLLVRTAILLFYWLFILVFVALGQGKLSTGEHHKNIEIIFFLNSTFNIAVFAFFLSQLQEFIRDFILNDQYKTEVPSGFISFFDSRTIIIHVVIVLGTFSHEFLAKYQEMDQRLPGLGFVGVLFVIKCLADLFTRWTVKGGGEPIKSLGGVWGTKPK